MDHEDGVLVVSHDPSINPDITRGRRRPLSSGARPAGLELSYDEFQRYDVGRLKPAPATPASNPEQQTRDGARIPRLADLFALVRSRATRRSASRSRPRSRRPRLASAGAGALRPGGRRGDPRGRLAALADPLVRLAHLVRGAEIAPEIPTAN